MCELFFPKIANKTKISKRIYKIRLGWGHSFDYIALPQIRFIRPYILPCDKEIKFLKFVSKMVGFPNK